MLRIQDIEKVNNLLKNNNYGNLTQQDILYLKTKNINLANKTKEQEQKEILIIYKMIVSYRLFLEDLEDLED